MKKAEIEIGAAYLIKVSGKVCKVKVTGENRHGGWDGINLDTNRNVRIKSAQRMRGTLICDAEEAATPAPVAAKTKSPVEQPKPQVEREPGGDSGLDAAVKVLQAAGTPLRCSDMVKTMIEAGFWKTSGKTPANTISAAILREIKVKGAESRFKKVDRGMFAAV